MGQAPSVIPDETDAVPMGEEWSRPMPLTDIADHVLEDRRNTVSSGVSMGRTA